MQQKTCTTEPPQRNAPSAITILPWLMVVCSMAIVLVWPIINAMALRNALLLTGGIIGAWYLFQERLSLYQKPALPLLFILLLFAWMGIHYFLFAHNPGLELEQIEGIGLRTLLGCLLGVGTGLFARDKPRAQFLLWVGFSSFAILFFFDYARVGFTRNEWTIPFPEGMLAAIDNFRIYAYKTSTVFYGIVSLALSCGVISYELRQAQKSNGHNFQAPIFFIGLTFLTFIFAGAKNGVAMSLILIFILFVIYLIKANKSFRTISIAATSIIFIGSLSYFHLKSEAERYDGWSNLIPSIEAGIQIDKYPNWKYYYTTLPGAGTPVVLPDGSVTRESVYLRTAYATKGLQVLLENPLGYGLFDLSFWYLTKESLPKGQPPYGIGVTHSGWLDFALGMGIPGLLLMWTAIAFAFYYSYQKKSRLSYCSRWMLASIFLVWTFSEICHNHFVETLFYLIALLSAGNLPVIEKVPQTNPNVF